MDLTNFFSLGFTHVLPLGYDHVLFILCMYFIHEGKKDLLLLSLCFTAGHSITLALGYLHLNPFPQEFAEALIALSISITALQPLGFFQFNSKKYLLVTTFGLLHGSGFAAALNEQLGTTQNWVKPLLLFNTGVEAAQVSILVFCYFLFGQILSKYSWYEKYVVLPLCSVCTAVGLTLALSRTLDLFQ